MEIEIVWFGYQTSPTPMSIYFTNEKKALIKALDFKRKYPPPFFFKKTHTHTHYTITNI